MPNPTAPGLSAKEPILINAAAAAAGISATKINRMIDDSVLPKSSYVKLGSRRALRAFAVPMVRFRTARNNWKVVSRCCPSTT